jgi:hypothetical protein
VRLRVIPLWVRWRLVIATLFCATSGDTGLAQSGGEELSRIGQTSRSPPSSYPKASLQAENGLTWTNDQLDRVATLCQTLLRLGLCHRTELRLTLPSYSLDFSRALGSSGVTDISIGFKQQLGPLPGGFDLSLIMASSVPAGTADKTTHRLDPFLKVPWSRELGNGWSVGGMASIFWPTEEGKRNLTWETTFVLQRDLSRSPDVFAEYGGDYPRRAGARQTIISEQPTESSQRTRSTFTSAWDCHRRHPARFSPSGIRFASIAFGANERTPRLIYRWRCLERSTSSRSSLVVNRH